jgi:hypothetical protein
MKIFESGGKINFVDDNNVLVGFDYESCCCENFGFYLTPEIPTSSYEGDHGEEIDFEGFQFDTQYFDDNLPDMHGEEGSAVGFRLIKGEEQIFLTLWNVHNGYYGHGFSMTCGNERLHDGTL